MAMNFQTRNFDGPLELLLQLISKAKIEIRDIFISDITEQYIAAIHENGFLDMNDAAEFLVMAATLLEIKSRAMLPKPPPLDEGEEDPEEALIRRLEEYKAFRETAGAMKEFEAAASRLFTRLPDEFRDGDCLLGVAEEAVTEQFLRQRNSCAAARVRIQTIPPDGSIQKKMDIASQCTRSCALQKAMSKFCSRLPIRSVRAQYSVVVYAGC